MFGPGSQQLRIFRRAVRDGATLEEACAATGGIINPAEGRIYLDADAKNPPGPACYELIPTPAALPDAANLKEMEMARGKAATEKVEEVKTMDFEAAKKLYLQDIKPAKSEASSQGQTVATAMKAIKKQCHVEPQGARKAFSAFEMEDAHREIHVRSFVGMFNALMGEEVLTCNFGDMVDQMQGHTKPKVTLATIGGKPPVPQSDGTETDLAGDDADDEGVGGAADDFEEATDEELAKQAGRKPRKPSIDNIASHPPAEAAE